MAKYRVTAPDGTTYEINAPDDATEDQVLDFARSRIGGPDQQQPADAGAVPVQTFPAAQPSSPVGMATQSMPAAQAGDVMEPPQQASFPPQRDIGMFQSWLEQIENISRGIGQRTNPNVYHGDASLLREPLGEITAEGDEGLFYGPAGARQLVNPKTDVVLRDPATGKLMAYRRNPEWDEGGVAGLSRLATQGLLTGPVTGAAKTAATASVPAVTSKAAPNTTQQILQAVNPRGAPQVAYEAGQSGIQARRFNEAIRDVEAFKEAGVRPVAPAFGEGPLSSVANQLSEIPFIGGPLRNALQESVEGVRDFSRGVASRLSPNTTIEEAGRTVQAGLDRFRNARAMDIVGKPAEQMSDAELLKYIRKPTRETSFASRAEAMYERAWRALPKMFKSNEAVNVGLIRPRASAEVLRGLLKAQESARISGGPLQGRFGKMVQSLMNPRSNWTIEALRNARTEVGRALRGFASDETGLDKTQLKQLYGALSRDLVAGVEELARRAEVASTLPRNSPKYVPPEVAAEARKAVLFFRAADNFTRIGNQRMENFMKVLNADHAELAAQRLKNAALSKGRGNLELLRTAKAALRPDEWNDFAGVLIHEMGKPVASAGGRSAEAGFSVNTLMTNLKNMEPQAIRLLFGSGDQELGRALENMVRMADRLSGFEKTLNTSRTATNLINVGATLGAAGGLASGNWLPTLGLGALGYGAALLLSRPAYVNWMTQAMKIRANIARLATDPARQVASRVNQAKWGSKAAERQWLAHVEKLRQLANRDPELGHIARSLADRLVGEEAERNREEENPLGPQQGEARP